MFQNKEYSKPHYRGTSYKLTDPQRRKYPDPTQSNLYLAKGKRTYLVCAGDLTDCEKAVTHLNEELTITHIGYAKRSLKRGIVE